MRKLIVSTLISLDGVFEDPRSWTGPYFDDTAAADSLAKLQESDAMLMGRGTYEYFAPAWSVATGPYPERVNEMRKYVFSRTLPTADWNNSTVVADDPVEAVAELKKQGDGHLMIYGYGRLSQTLLEHDLVDELVFAIHPVILGKGASISRPAVPRTLQLASVEQRDTGAVWITYAGRDSGNPK
jgi:dihydrofolate reductase